MTVGEAICILNPETSASVIYQMREDGLSNDEVMNKVDEACILACVIMQKYLKENDDNAN